MQIVEQASDVQNGAISDVAQPGEAVVTRAKYAETWRKIAWDVAAVAAPIATGILVARATDRRSRGIFAGAAAALALGALRTQMARWFSPIPDYEVIATAGGLELREYRALVEATTIIDAPDIETALDRGFDRLAVYLFGANSPSESLEMVAPVLTEMTEGRYRVSFVMPPGRSLASLPLPEDARVELRERPAQHIAALKFHGTFSPENIHAHERKLLSLVVDAGLVGRGSVTFAGYDAPMTAPFLRRNELWLNVA